MDLLLYQFYLDNFDINNLLIVTTQIIMSKIEVPSLALI